MAVEAELLARVSLSAPAYSRPVSHGPWRPRPISTCPSSRSSSSSTFAESSGLRRPLHMVSMHPPQLKSRAESQMFSLYLPFVSTTYHFGSSHNSPIVLNRLNYKTEGRADGIDILVHDLLHDRGLSCIIKTALVSQRSFILDHPATLTASVSSSPYLSGELSARLTTSCFGLIFCRGKSTRQFHKLETPSTRSRAVDQAPISGDISGARHTINSPSSS